jgi:hypothetical protein
MHVGILIITIVGAVEVRVLLAKAQHSPYTREWKGKEDELQPGEQCVYTVAVRFSNGTVGSYTSTNPATAEMVVGQTYEINATMSVMGSAGPYQQFA